MVNSNDNQLLECGRPYDGKLKIVTLQCDRGFKGVGQRLTKTKWVDLGHDLPIQITSVIGPTTIHLVGSWVRSVVS